MTDNGTALMQRTLTDNQIRQRIELNKQAGWGLEKGTPAQLNYVFLLCQKFQLLPGDDVTLYDGKPWITIDGRVKLARRHPEYRGHSTRPLTKDEKEAWGYDPDDLVVEATIRTATCGEIQARGKVSKAERYGQQAQGQRLNFVARIHPVEMAEKRALARAERFAFGTDAVIDDEDAEGMARTFVQERNEPDRVALGAAKYDRIIGSAYDDERPAAVRNPIERGDWKPNEPHADPYPDDGRESELEPVAMVKNRSHASWKAWVDATVKASANDVPFDEIELPIAESVLRAATETLSEMVTDKAGAEQESF